MFLVDSCGWIEWLTDGKLSKFFMPYLENTQELLVPTLVQFELYKWICRERDETIAIEIIGLTEQANVIPLDTSLALLAADLSKEYKLAAADAIVYATSQMHKSSLITSDKHFKDLSDVKYFSKS